MKNYFANHGSLMSTHYRGYILLFLLALIVVEIIWSWRNDKKAYDVKETFANTVVLLGFQLSKIVFAGYQLAVLGFASSISIFKLGHNGWVFATCFMLADFVYYWFHRTSHSWLPLWAFHHVHHSSPHMNLTSAYRLNWFGALVSPVFFVPLALLGFPPEYIVLSYALNLLYQFFLHTEAVGKLGAIEGVVDTPSAHRVHHGQNEIYIDKTLAAFLCGGTGFLTPTSPKPKKYGTAYPEKRLPTTRLNWFFRGLLICLKQGV